MTVADTETATSKAERAQVQELFDRPSSRIFVTSATGQTIAVCESGSPTGTPVFSLTGTGGCRLDALLRHKEAVEGNVRLFAIDKPGSGLSDESQKPARGAPRKNPFFIVADLIVEVADALDIPKFGVIAYSLGTCDALALAKRHPGRLLGPIQVVGAWTMPDTPGTLSWIKVAVKLPMGVISGFVKAGIVLQWDYAWIGEALSSLLAITTKMFSCLSSRRTEKDQEEDLETASNDGPLEKEEQAFDRSPAVRQLGLLEAKLRIIAHVWSRKPRLSSREAEDRAMVEMSKTPGSTRVAQADVRAELDCGRFRMQSYLIDAVLYDIGRALGKRGSLDVDLSTVMYPVHIRHGTEDQLVPVLAVEALTKALPYEQGYFGGNFGAILKFGLDSHKNVVSAKKAHVKKFLVDFEWCPALGKASPISSSGKHGSDKYEDPAYGRITLSPTKFIGKNMCLSVSPVGAGSYNDTRYLYAAKCSSDTTPSAHQTFIRGYFEPTDFSAIFWVGNEQVAGHKGGWGVASKRNATTQDFSPVFHADGRVQLRRYEGVQDEHVTAIELYPVNPQ
ncbi:hypothetical protein HKX48_009389 [Thoreauomyces humboldtii]|nr:hypothetical protein HKX48_009389 [Thoreauomyces humboldtii]